MERTSRLTPRSAFFVVLLAMVGSITGTLFGPRAVAVLHSAPPWLLPAILIASVLLASLAGYTALKLAQSSRQHRSLSAQDEA